MTQKPSLEPVSPRRPGRAVLPLVIVLALAPALACKKAERSAGGPPGSPAPAAAAATPVPPADAPPVLRDTAEAGRAPWAGLAEPRGAALDARGRLWVTDFGHSRIAIFDAAGGYLGGWGGVKGNGKYQLQDPGDVTIRGEDVYVADTWNGRVQQFTTAAKFARTALAELYGPRGVAVAPDGVVWISDSGNNRMALLAPGQPPRFVGKAGAGADGLSFPVGVAAGPSHVYVADIGNHRIQVFGLDGKVQRSIPVSAWKETMEPYLAVDDRENIYASVPSGSRVLELDRSGRLLRQWDTDDAGSKLVKPTGLALDGKAGVLYVVDAGSNTVTAIHLQGRKS